MTGLWGLTIVSTGKVLNIETKCRPNIRFSIQLAWDAVPKATVAANARMFLQESYSFLIGELIFNAFAFKRDSLDWGLCDPLLVTLLFI